MKLKALRKPPLTFRKLKLKTVARVVKLLPYVVKPVMVMAKRVKASKSQMTRREVRKSPKSLVALRKSNLINQSHPEDLPELMQEPLPLSQRNQL